MNGYYYSFVASQGDGDPIIQEFNHLSDAVDFGSTFMECSPDDKAPAFTIVRRREEDRHDN